MEVDSRRAAAHAVVNAPDASALWHKRGKPTA